MTQDAAAGNLDPHWRGVPFDALLELTHRTGAAAETLYVLLRLRPVLGTWRAEAAADARYRLAVKGLTGALQDHPQLGPQLRTSHRRLAEEALTVLTPPAGEPRPAAVAGPATALQLRHALAHGEASGDEDLRLRIAGDRGLLGEIETRGNTAETALDLPGAIAWWTVCLLHAGVMARTGETVWINAQAAVYMNRGNAKQQASGHGPGLAIADYDAAIGLREALRAELEPTGRWEMGLRNDLAGAYMNRGNAKAQASGHGPGLAIADYDDAIALMEALRAELEPTGRWAPGLRNALAAAYMNRGNAKQHASGHGPTPAIADFGCAIRIREGMRDALIAARGNAGWSHVQRFELAQGYLFRASLTGPRRGREDLAAARRIADGLAQLGYEQLAMGIRGGCVAAGLPRIVTWLMRRLGRLGWVQRAAQRAKSQAMWSDKP